jgi:hypothetical protein
MDLLYLTQKRDLFDAGSKYGHTPINSTHGQALGVTPGGVGVVCVRLGTKLKLC